MPDDNPSFFVRLTIKENEEIITDKVLHDEKEISAAIFEIQDKLAAMFMEQKNGGVNCFPKSLNVIVSHQESYSQSRRPLNNSDESKFAGDFSSY